jgi:adenosylmethionine-8-amino-7-oxononanoate aminotransferase
MAVELATRLLGKLGAPFEKIFYSDDGSTAVECALKMALQFWRLDGKPERSRFASLDRAYHGDTLGAVKVSQISEFHHFFAGERGQAVVLPVPYTYRWPEPIDPDECVKECLRRAERIFDEHGPHLAALIIEPRVLGAAGMVMYPASYLEGLVRLCRAHDVLVIFDEVFTGFGRTGSLFALDTLADAPDIVCLSKGLTSGMLPMGVTATRGRVFEAFCGGPERTFYHGHTFTGNALACAVAVESLKLFDDEGVLTRNQSLSAQMSDERARFERLPVVGEVRQLGMIWAVELVRDRKTKAIPNPPNGPGWKIADELWREGIWTRPLHQMLYCVPPYCSTREDLRHFFEVLYCALTNEDHFRE